MAGSYKMLIDDDGRFTMDRIDNLGDATEALEECVTIIAEYENDEVQFRRELRLRVRQGRAAVESMIPAAADMADVDWALVNEFLIAAKKLDQ